MNFRLKSNKIKHIGELPNSIEKIFLHCKQLKDIPNIPTNLNLLEYMDYNNLIIPKSNIKYKLIKRVTKNY